MKLPPLPQILAHRRPQQIGESLRGKGPLSEASTLNLGLQVALMNWRVTQGQGAP